LDHALLVGIGRRGGRRVLESDGDAIIPAAVLGHVIGGGLDLHRKHAAGFDVLLQQWIVVLQKELQELLLVSPLDLVVVLHGIRLVGGTLRRGALRQKGPRGNREQQGE